jgi:hypothetical protein
MLVPLLVGAAILVTPSRAERVVIFKAAGFTPTTGDYLMCDKETPLGLEVRDINGDGRLDAIVTDGGTECYGDSGTGFTLLTHTAMGKWTKLTASQGIPNFLKTRANGWPELEVGGPGFCFPVLRWTGKAFATHRHHYQGKPCKR